MTIAVMSRMTQIVVTKGYQKFKFELDYTHKTATLEKRRIGVVYSPFGRPVEKRFTSTRYVITLL